MRLIFRLLGALAITLVLVVGGLFLLPADRIAGIAADQIRAATGREVSFGNDVSLSFYPSLGIRTGAVKIANPDWAGDTPMMVAKSMTVAVDTMALLGGAVEVQRLELVSPDLVLIRDKAGRGNWELPAADDGGKVSVSLPDARVTNARVRFVDMGAGTETVIKNVDATLSLPDLAGRADLDLLLRPNGVKVTINAKTRSFSDLVEGRVAPISAVVNTAGGHVALSGTGTIAGAYSGGVELDLADPGAFTAALMGTRTELPDGLGKKIVLKGDLTVTRATRISLRNMAATLGVNALQGEADIDLGGARPQVKARLRADHLDLSGLSKGDSAGAGTGWSTTPIDASGLGALNGNIRLTANAVDLGTAKTGATDVTLTIDRSRAVFTLGDVTAYEGKVSGEFVMNNRNGLSVGGKLALNGVEVQGLLRDLADITRVEGKMNARVGFLGVGQSVDAIMNSFKGDGNVAMGQGKITGIDLDKLLSTGVQTAGTTIFNALSASFTMAGGNLVSEDLKASLSRVATTGRGRIGLGAQDMDYRLTPVLLKSDGSAGTAFPVRIRGPWANLRFEPDLKAAIDANLAEEKEELKSKVEAEVEKIETKAKKKISEKLGAEIDDAEDLEKAIGKKIEDEIGKGLLKLLK